MKTWWPLVAGFVLLIFGNGMYWSWRELELKKMVNIAQLRNDENAIFRDMINLTQEYVEVYHEYAGKSADTRTNTRIANLISQMKRRRADFDAIERNLARLESREPQSVNLDFPTPTPPTILRIEPAPKS